MHAVRDHERAVDTLRRSYAAVPAGEPVRLAKQTSNLFRPRSAPRTPGLDVSGLTGVLAVDADARTADVQGMCTYEDLVDATLPHGLMPLVVPQLRTITLGGAVTGLGIESTSFRNGLPHESVLEMDLLTGAGDLITARPEGEHAELFRAFPNSLGSLGYATRLRIELQPIRRYVALRNIRFTRLEELTDAIGEVITKGSWEGDPVDAMDGVMFSPGEAYLVLGTFTDDAAGHPSDYTGQDIYYRSLRRRTRDVLTGYDYLWRWDTDWFWCSAAFGVQHPVVRRLWPQRYRRSDFYHRLVRLEHRHQVAARIDRWRGRPARERVVQDVEIPLDGTADFLRWFAKNVGMTPVWLCPLRLREPAGPGSARTWPLYPLQPGETYVNIGFWGSVPIAEGAADGDVNREIERAVSEAGGHKSLYSDAYYDRASFDRLYGGPAWQAVKDRYDPDHRLTGLYEKAVARQ
ncbi:MULTISPECIES: FAD-binding oxidoreductase [Micromonospora]|uniref:Delta(24)-sterol reductase n=1 Tax=Micromonospora solifontis TaxID=2487138 RepID=A0ABX9WFD4_9ACTN|nr:MULTISPECIES: FAD-binding oxidoreductase [Micromonospora]NES16395.1 FAD-binding oxidoreductase [Micromonospora sp. PPF5-17B]NES37252.1 FAD-binding oxidoreductase [Micromonospora solifontis]NES57111.1 FAD-binding oxidoreductase [Micromonospora sp. PPF5-6]RNL98600.1 FAD-binding oxidoreductase [Micromonospora solifontis]